MGQVRGLNSAVDLPSNLRISNLNQQAMKLNDIITKPVHTIPKSRTEPVVPDDLQAALKNHNQALSTFESFSYSNQKEYVECLNEAKRAGTRQKRLATTIEWLSEGKVRNWKYLDC